MKFDKTAVLINKRFKIKFKDKEQLYSTYGAVKLCIMENMADTREELDGMLEVLQNLAVMYDSKHQKTYPQKFDLPYAKWRSVWHCCNVVLQNDLVPEIKAINWIKATQGVLASHLDRVAENHQKHLKQHSHILP